MRCPNILVFSHGPTGPNGAVGVRGHRGDIGSAGPLQMHGEWGPEPRGIVCDDESGFSAGAGVSDPIMDGSAGQLADTGRLSQ
jgi:hypothetical protein